MRKDRGIAAAFALVLLAGCAALPEHSESVALPYIGSFSASRPDGDLPHGWQPWTLSKFKKATQYQLVDDAGKTVVKASAHSSASGLVHSLNVVPKKFPLLSWRWKVTGLIAKADNSKKHADDSPARIAISFDGNLDALPLHDRMFFDDVRLLTGQQLPYAMLIYIWENRAPKGSVIPNLHTSRIKMIVAESGRDKVGAWQEVTRNLYEDFKRAFGEEPGTVTAIGIMTDTDNTGENIQAYYGDIQFRRIAPPRVTFTSD